MTVILIGYSKYLHLLYSKKVLLSAYDLIGYSLYDFLVTLKRLLYSAILLTTLQCNYRNKPVRFGIKYTPTIETNVWQTKSLCD